MSDALDAALMALACDDDEQALEHLVAAWDGCRAAPLVALIDTLAERIEPRHKALAGKTANERYEAFRATAARTRQGELSSLVAMLPKLAYGDVSTALDTLLYDWPYTPRMRALLEPVRLPGYTDRIEELRTVHAKPRDVTLPPKALVTLAELERLLAGGDRRGGELLAQVFADPAADAPRLVYADWLTSRGDPRGELITLQFARRERKPDAAAVRRERELLDQYMQRWLAPLWSSIRQYSVRFERGFLASVTVEPFAVIAARPEWATVVALELAYHEALPIDAFPALRELRNVTPKLLAQIAGSQTLVHVGLADEPGNRSIPLLAELTAGVAFPALRSLGLWGAPNDWAWIWETPFAARLERLEVTRQYAGESPWLAAVPPSIREVRICERSNEARLVRDGVAFPSLELVCREPTRDVNAWAHMLHFIPANTLRSARFVLPYRPKQETVGRLERIARNSHPALENFTLDVDPFV